MIHLDTIMKILHVDTATAKDYIAHNYKLLRALNLPPISFMRSLYVEAKNNNLEDDIVGIFMAIEHENNLELFAIILEETHSNRIIRCILYKLISSDQSAHLDLAKKFLKSKHKEVEELRKVLIAQKILLDLKTV